MKTIPLPSGKTKVSDKDFEYLSQFKWMLDKTGYVIRWSKMVNGKRKWIRMHREILNAPKGKQVDHINGNRLDNQRENLRICNNQENANNRHKPRKKIYSKYKGVYWDKRQPGKWRVKMTVNGKNIHGGTYKSEKEAASKYNELATQYQGKFAKLNKI